MIPPDPSAAESWRASTAGGTSLSLSQPSDGNVCAAAAAVRSRRLRIPSTALLPERGVSVLGHLRRRDGRFRVSTRRLAVIMASFVLVEALSPLLLVPPPSPTTATVEAAGVDIQRREVQRLSGAKPSVPVATEFSAGKAAKARPRVVVVPPLRGGRSIVAPSSAEGRGNVLGAFGGTLKRGSVIIDPLDNSAANPPRSGHYYASHRAVPFEHGECVATAEWQRQAVSSCNELHALRFDFSSSTSALDGRMENKGKGEDDHAGEIFVDCLGSGTYRDARKVRVRRLSQEEGGPEFAVLKTLHPRGRWDEDVVDSHQREAMAMSQMRSSKHVLRIYGNCAASLLVEYAPGSDMRSNSESGRIDRADPEEMLRLAADAAAAVADSHLFERVGSAHLASLVNTDIKPEQFVYVDGTYKLGDFNEAKFLAYRPGPSTCSYHPPWDAPQHGSSFHAPEEYAGGVSKSGGRAKLTDRTDVYVLGNVIYYLLTGLYPFEDVEGVAKKKAVMILSGRRPDLPARVLEGEKGPAVRKNSAWMALAEAVRACWAHDPADRPSSRDVADALRRAVAGGAH